MVNRIKTHLDSFVSAPLKASELTDLVEIYWSTKADRFIVTGQSKPPFFHGQGVKKAVHVGLEFGIESVEIPYELLNSLVRSHSLYRPNAYVVDVEKRVGDTSVFNYKLYRIEV